MVLSLSILVYRKSAERVKELSGGKKIGSREVIVTIIFISVLITIIGLIPSYALQVLLIAALSYILFIFTYLFSKRLFISAIPPAAFVISFLLLSRLLATNILVAIMTTNFFATVFAVIAVALLGPLFSWKTLMLFTALLTIVDIVHVFITGHMVVAAYKVMGLGLPLMFLLPRLPSLTELTVLGLGDVFLSGLLSTYMASKYNFKAGLLTATSISIIFLAFDIIVYNFAQGVKVFPATILVLIGWLLGKSLYLLKLKIWRAGLVKSQR